MSYYVEPPKFCAWCGVDMFPENEDDIYCPNGDDICINCCGEEGQH